MSVPVTVTLDTTYPSPPASLSAETREGGIIRLSWPASAGDNIAGYNLYRAAQSFTNTASATRVNTNRITSTTYNDMPATDGLWYYRVAAVNQAQNQSELSQEVSAKSDSTGPRAVSIQYMPQGNVDPVTKAMAPGRVDILLTVNRLIVFPISPIRNNSQTPVEVQATIGLTEKVKPGTQAELSYTVTGQTYPISMTMIETQSGDQETWQGSFTLPSTAGLTPESL